MKTKAYIVYKRAIKKEDMNYYRNLWIITEIYELLQKKRMKNMKEKYELLHKRKNDLWRTIRVRFPANLKLGRIMEIHRQK